MSMSAKIMFSAAIFFGGWLWAYLFVRQFLFNCVTAFPLIKKMNAIQPDLIAVGAKRYTTISCVVCALVSAIILFVVIRFCPLYLLISFAVGAAAAILMLLGRISPKNKAMFEAFCASYCRFVPDDELRTAMFNKKPGEIRSRLRAMGYIDSFVPEFKN